jgi:hypothetical protein
MPHKHGSGNGISWLCPVAFFVQDAKDNKAFEQTWLTMCASIADLRRVSLEDAAMLLEACAADDYTYRWHVP